MSKVAYIFIWLLIYAIPLENVFVFEGFGTISRIIGVFSLFFGIAAMIIEKRHRSINILHILMVIFILWSVASFFWSIDQEFSKLSIITLGQLLVMVLLIWELAWTETEQEGLIKAYVLGSGTSCLGTIISYQAESQTAYLRYAAFGFDANDMGLILAISLPMAWYLSLRCQGRAERLLYRSYLPLAFFAIMLTGSRGSFIASMVALVYILWTIEHFNKISRFAIFLVLLGGAVVMIDRIPSASWTRISTIGQEMTSGSLNSRLDIWQSALEAIAKDPILGIGSGAFNAGIESTYGTPVSAHNLFLSIWLTLGIVGLLIFLAMLYVALINIFRMPPEKFKFWIVLMATWFAGVMGLNWEFRKPTWFLIGLLVCQTVKCQRKEGYVTEIEFTKNPLDSFEVPGHQDLKVTYQKER